MQQFLVLFREPHGRKDPHTPEPNVDHGSTGRRPIISPFPSEGKFPDDPETEKLAEHRKSWNLWSEQMNKEHRIIGGMPLSLSGRVLHATNIRGANHWINEGPGPSVDEGFSPSITEGPHKVGQEIVAATCSSTLTAWMKPPRSCKAAPSSNSAAMRRSARS